MAFSLFWSCERSWVQRTNRPVGMCRIRTAVSTLFTFWPPAPPEREVVISRSLSGMSSFTSSSSLGITSTPAKLVWRLSLALNGEMRTSRWVPFSLRR